MVIVDANLLVALVSGDARGAQVQQQFLQWLGDSVDLHAPALARYEVANASDEAHRCQSLPRG